jgi:hypothetical protein
MWLVGVNLPFVLHRATTTYSSLVCQQGELAISSNPERRKSETGSRYQAQLLGTFSALYCVVLCCTVLLILGHSEKSLSNALRAPFQPQIGNFGIFTQEINQKLTNNRQNSQIITKLGNKLAVAMVISSK